MKKIKKVSLGVIFYKNLKYIPKFLETIFNQKKFNGEIEYIFRDQDPEKEVFFYIKKNFPEYFEKIKFFTKDGGFHSEGHNFLIKKSEGDLYFCLSNDMIYPENLVSKFVDFFEKNNEKIATCKIKRWDFSIFAKTGNLEKSKSNFIDSIGIGICENHHFYDIGQGEKDFGQYDNLKEIFGPSGAFFVCDKNFFENNFFDEKNIPHYKNDCDFSYKLNWQGISTKILTNIEVYHDRQLEGNGKKIFGKIKNLRERNDFFLGDSLKGHLNLLKKNFTFKFGAKIFLKTFANEVKKFLFFLIFKPKLLKIYFDFWKNSGKIEKNFDEKLENFGEKMKKILEQME
ncbi:glycosyltransferase [Candidatus Gracilibacteria bacterium]|nr:glycosyltransferase [Candidatus Gracilibacteria bacterium]